ncbi:hypothetical protein [Halarchaeum sp. P4]|uniref:hypothetical protein n=1 Tax=Halarchaeum sp. P4 TaxID=3421639 RepID=UPI003EBB96BF
MSSVSPERPWIYCTACWEAIAGWDEWDEHQNGGCRGFPIDGHENRASSDNANPDGGESA